MDNSAVNKIVTDLSNSIAQQWSATMADRCALTVGLSGGLDSVVLLHLLSQLRAVLPIQVSAIHVHHGLSSYADEWLSFCQQLCSSWSIPLQTIKVDVQTKGDGVEAAARKARYQAYANTNADAVVLAHHRDDQVETFFLGAMRGGGLRALAAMPAQRNLTSHSILWRPLLHFSRQTLKTYAEAMKLSYIEDDSNTDTQYLRNWLRINGLPQWRTHFPYLDNQVEASVSCLQDELTLVEEIIAADWEWLHAQQQGFQVSLWRELSDARRKQQLRLFAHKHKLGMSSTAALTEFARQLMENKIGAEWRLPLGEIFYYDSKLWIKNKDLSKKWPWLSLIPANIHCSTLSNYIQWNQHSFGLPEIATNWTLRLVTTQDTIMLQSGRKNVKKLLQTRKIPPFMRQIWPVICNAENQCIAVVNVAVATDLGIAGGWVPVTTDLPDKF